MLEFSSDILGDSSCFLLIHWFRRHGWLTIWWTASLWLWISLIRFWRNIIHSFIWWFSFCHRSLPQDSGCRLTVDLSPFASTGKTPPAKTFCKVVCTGGAFISVKPMPNSSYVTHYPWWLQIIETQWKLHKTLNMKMLWLALTFLADKAGVAPPVSKSLRSSHSSFLIFVTRSFVYLPTMEKLGHNSI